MLGCNLRARWGPVRVCAESSLDEANQQLVELLVREEVARHVTAMYTLDRIAAKDWARVRLLMASINQVSPHPPIYPPPPLPFSRPPNCTSTSLLPAFCPILVVVTVST